MYLEALKAREGRFECLAFAIYDTGYSPNDEPPFREVFEARPSR